MRCLPRHCHVPRPVALILVLVALFWAVPAVAQHLGVRAGVSANPDQFFAGAHLDAGRVSDRLSFRPNLEVGYGQDQTTVAANVEFAYWFQNGTYAWQPYLTAGPAVVGHWHPRGRDGDPDIEPGFNVGLGLQHDRGFFLEVKLGVIDSPEAKMMLGLSFR